MTYFCGFCGVWTNYSLFFFLKIFCQLCLDTICLQAFEGSWDTYGELASWCLIRSPDLWVSVRADLHSCFWHNVRDDCLSITCPIYATVEETKNKLYSLCACSIHDTFSFTFRNFWLFPFVFYFLINLFRLYSLKSCEPEFVVSTPERLLDLISLKAINISAISSLVTFTFSLILHMVLGLYLHTPLFT